MRADSAPLTVALSPVLLKFKSEEFEGVAPGNLYGNMATELQKMLLGQIASVVRAVTAFLPGAKRNKRD